MEIVRYPRGILREKARPIGKISDAIFRLADSMISLMVENRGIGLAANQVGELYRLFVINLNPFEDKPELMVVINPKIIDREGIDIDEEGCLSFPGLYLNIPRSRKIRLHMQNLYNERIILDTQGIVARAIQHEIDHLDGILFIDYVSEEEKPKLERYLDGLKNNNSSFKLNNI